MHYSFLLKSIYIWFHLSDFEDRCQISPFGFWWPMSDLTYRTLMPDLEAHRMDFDDRSPISHIGLWRLTSDTIHQTQTSNLGSNIQTKSSVLELNSDLRRNLDHYGMQSQTFGFYLKIREFHRCFGFWPDPWILVLLIQFVRICATFNSPRFRCSDCA